MKNRGIKRRPRRAGENRIDRMIGGLQDELKKYTHYTKLEMDHYYFVKRLKEYINSYDAYMNFVTKQTMLAMNSITNLKRVARLKKKKKK